MPKVPRSPLTRVSEFLQPPALYLLGSLALVFAVPLRATLGDEVSRLLTCIAFNAILYAFSRTTLPLRARPRATALGAVLGALVAFPSAFGGSFTPITAVAAILVVIDASWEEVLFRGLAFDFTLRRYGPWGALALSSVWFASAHLFDAATHNLVTFSYLVLAGVVMGAIRVVSGSLWPAITFHAAHNLLLSCSTVDDTHWGSLAAVGVAAAALLVRVRAVPAPDTGTSETP